MKQVIIPTHKGIIDLLNPSSEMIDIDDIVHALNYICRWNGRCDAFYSVLQHSICVAHLFPSTNPRIQMYKLMHDAAEAYIGDIISPIKQFLANFHVIENDIMKIIAQKYGFYQEFVNHPLYPAMHEEVKRADYMALILESLYCFNDMRSYDSIIQRDGQVFSKQEIEKCEEIYLALCSSKDDPKEKFKALCFQYEQEIKNGTD